MKTKVIDMTLTELLKKIFFVGRCFLSHPPKASTAEFNQGPSICRAKNRRDELSPALLCMDNEEHAASLTVCSQ